MFRKRERSPRGSAWTDPRVTNVVPGSRMADDGIRSEPVPVNDAGSLGSAEVSARILIVRNRRVMLDVDVAAVYGVGQERLDEQVERNRARCPGEFLFDLTLGEALWTQTSTLLIATLKRGRNIKHAPTLSPITARHARRRAQQSCRHRDPHPDRSRLRCYAWTAPVREGLPKLDALGARFDRMFQIVFEAFRPLMKPASPWSPRFQSSGRQPPHR